MQSGRDDSIDKQKEQEIHLNQIEYDIKEKSDTPAQDGAEPDARATELEDALRQRDEYIALSQRVQADFDNFRRRNASIRAEACTEGVQDAVLALLPVLDNLERAAACGATNEGVALIVRQFRDALQALGVEPVPTEGQPFDPHLHEALMQRPPCDGEQCGDIQTVFTKGYTLNGKVIRHSKVQVAGE